MKRTLLLLLLPLALRVTAAPIPEESKIGGFAIGCQAYTFNRFSVFEAIERTEAAGGKVIEFYPGQVLAKEEPNVKWSHDAGDEVIQRVKEKLARHKVRAVNYGVVAIPNDEAQARKIFEFARKLELYGITTESVDSLDIAEKLAKEFDIRVGIHEHARRNNDPKYKLWDPNYVLSLVKDRDRRIGACADTGHWATSGLKPLECIRILKGRIVSSHLKERAALGPGQHDTVFGAGTTDIAGILAELKSQGFAGNISIEYEYNWDHSVPEIAQCIGFVRGWAASQR